MRLLGLKLADGYSSEARVFASLLGARPNSAIADDIHVVYHDWPGDRTSACAFEQDARVGLTRLDVGWRPTYPTRPLAAKVTGRLRFQLAQPRLRRLARAYQPDIVLSSQQKWDCRAATVIAERLRVPQVIHLHYNVGSWLGAGTLRRLRTCAHIVTVSQFVRRQVLALGVPANRVTTIHNPITLPRRLWLERRSPIRNEFGIPFEDTLITFVARLDPGKGHHEALQAFTRVAETHPEAHLLIVGDGEIHAELAKAAQVLPAADRIKFAGYRADVAEVLATSNIFFHPSFSEPFGLAVLEASAAGLPVVAFADGGIPEIVVDGKTGLLVEPGDVSRLAAALERLIDDRALASELGAAGAARVQSVFKPSAAATQFFGVLHRVARAHDATVPAPRREPGQPGRNRDGTNARWSGR